MIQVAPAHITLDEGLENLAMLRLSAGGTLRFHSRCCNTPVANLSTSARLPLASLAGAFVSSSEDTEAVFGPVLARVQGKSSSSTDSEVHPSIPLGVVIRTARQLATDFIKGRASPTPFFNDDGSPVVEARVISAEERDQARRMAGLG